MEKTTSLTQRVTLAILAVMLCVPMASRFVSIPRYPLAGMETIYTHPKWSWKSFQKGRYQGAWDVWATRAHPLWSWSIAVTNELIYRLTGEISLDYGASIQGGVGGYLWQPMYLKSFNGNREPQAGQIQKAFEQLAQAQALLKTHNIPLIGVITPNVLNLYPELVPNKYKAVRPGPKDYDIACKAIQRSGAEVVDMYAFLKSIQGAYPIRFFEPTGSHWNDIAICLAVKEISPKLTSVWAEEIPEPRCEQFTIEPVPRVAELDLVSIANLLSPHSVARPAPYVTAPVQASLKKPKRVLLVGTSFLFGLEKELLRRKIADLTTLLFYFRQIRQNGHESFAAFDRRNVTREFLLSYDAIIVDANVSAPGSIGRGVLPAIIRALSNSGAGNVP